MTANAIRRIAKTTQEKNKDFYQTYPAMVEVLVDWLKISGISSHSSILDPCAGKGVIWKNLRGYFYNIHSIDRYMIRRKHSFYLHHQNYDLIVMNPPYGKQKYKFIQKSWKQATYTIALLPYNMCNYNDFHANYMDIPTFVGKIVMTPKVILHEGTDLKLGGTTSYAWFIWNKNHSSTPSQEWYYDLRKYLT